MSDLEKYQALRIEALEVELLKYKNFLEEIKKEFEKFSNELANDIEVIL